MKKEHDYLICIGSDGCAMDTMNSKHFYCFGPEWVKQYGLEDIKEEALKYWNQINLYSKTRGINRFKGLAMGLEWAKEKGYETEGQEEFVAWTKDRSFQILPFWLNARKRRIPVWNRHFCGVFMSILPSKSREWNREHSTESEKH
mgnify:CR=1 FL=1